MFPVTDRHRWPVHWSRHTHRTGNSCHIRREPGKQIYRHKGRVIFSTQVLRQSMKRKSDEQMKTEQRHNSQTYVTPSIDLNSFILSNLRPLEHPSHISLVSAFSHTPSLIVYITTTESQTQWLLPVQISHIIRGIVHPKMTICLLLCFLFIRFGEILHTICSEWVPSECESKHLIKNTTIIHTTPVHQLKVSCCTPFRSFILGLDVFKNIYLRYKYHKPSQYIFTFRSSSKNKSICPV